MNNETTFQLPYQVYVSDQLAEESDSLRPSGGFSTQDEAITAAKKIIDDQLVADFNKLPNEHALVLLDGLLEFGFVPLVMGPTGSVLFNAREYAEKKCYEIKGEPIPDRLVWGRPNVP